MSFLFSVGAGSVIPRGYISLSGIWEVGMASGQDMVADAPKPKCPVKCPLTRAMVHGCQGNSDGCAHPQGPAAHSTASAAQRHLWLPLSLLPLPISSSREIGHQQSQPINMHRGPWPAQPSRERGGDHILHITHYKTILYTMPCDTSNDTPQK